MAGLREADVLPDPIEQFRLWYQEARQTDWPLPEAMTLATATPDGKPSARIVLLKGFDASGFVFFTNYQSRKGVELEANPHAALVFHWPQLERQVRVEGTVRRVSEAESDAYFRSRPRGSQISACASPQSAVVPDRRSLEQKAEQLGRDLADAVIPRPGSWGGYRLTPSSIEFWVHRPDRLHDRLRYRSDRTGGWVIERLAP